MKAALSAQDLREDRYWPPESADNVCALQSTSFERRGLWADEFERRVSSLLQRGPEALALILGLVWGNGLRGIRRLAWRYRAGRRNTPYFRTTQGSSMGTQQTLLTLPGFGRPSTNRPLNNSELAKLMGKYAALSEQAQRVLDLALRRLRDSTERTELEDKVIDLGIVLEALFSKGLTVYERPFRLEGHGTSRIHTRRESKPVCYSRSSMMIVHMLSMATSPGIQQENKRESRCVAHCSPALRTWSGASLKTMIVEGQPQDWDDSEDPSSIRHVPPRAETEIPSVKSDSLSWSLKEQKQSTALWRPYGSQKVDNAPPPPPDAAPGSHEGIMPKQSNGADNRESPTSSASPSGYIWLTPNGPSRNVTAVDERTKYYCSKDVERHLQRWQNGAAEKKMYRFYLPLEDPTMYLPEAFDGWRLILRQGEQR